MVLIGSQRLDMKMSLVRAGPRPDCKEQGLAPRQKLGSPVADFSFAPVQLGQLLAFAIGSMGLEHGGSAEGRIVNKVILAPCPAIASSGVAQSLWCSSGCGHFLKLVLSEEPNPLSIGREEGAARVVGAVDRLDLSAVDGPQIQLGFSIS